KKGDIPGFERQYLFQDMRYARAAETLLRDIEKGTYRMNPFDNHPMDDPDKGSIGYFRIVSSDAADEQLNAALEGTAASIRRLEKVTATADSIYDKLENGKIFFDDN